MSNYHQALLIMYGIASVVTCFYSFRWYDEQEPRQRVISTILTGIFWPLMLGAVLLAVLLCIPLGLHHLIVVAIKNDYNVQTPARRLWEWL